MDREWKGMVRVPGVVVYGENSGNVRRVTALVTIVGGLVGLAVLVGLVGCNRAAPGSGDRDTLTIGAYSVVREALREPDGVLAGFAEHWKATTGREVRFEESYNASGAQARAIVSGFDADVALLSHEGDVKLLADAGLVAKDWNADNRAMVTRSLVVIGVRPGNPRGITDFADLAGDGIGVLYPDPKTSGGARWNINAMYGAALRQAALEGATPEAAREAAIERLRAVQRRVVTMDTSGRASLTVFEGGTGDAIVTYENEIRLQNLRAEKSQGRSAAIPQIVPPATLLIESPAVLVETSTSRHHNRELAQAFLDYLHTDDGQARFRRYGFRSLREPPPQGVFTLKDLGGWSSLSKLLYGPDGLWTQLFLEPRSGGR